MLTDTAAVQLYERIQQLIDDGPAELDDWMLGTRQIGGITLKRGIARSPYVVVLRHNEPVFALSEGPMDGINTHTRAKRYGLPQRTPNAAERKRIQATIDAILSMEPRLPTRQATTPSIPEDLFSPEVLGLY